MDALTVILDVLGILAIICFGAFIIALVADLILSVFDKHEGIFFNRKHKKDKEEPEVKNQDIVVYTNKENPNKPVEMLVYNEPEVETNDVDYDKAAQEQLEAMKFMQETMPEPEPAPVVEEPEEDFDAILEEVTSAAIKEIEAEQAEEKIVIAPDEKHEDKVKVVYQVLEQEDDEFKKLREDIFKIRRSAFNDLQDKTKANVAEENEADEEYRQKLIELENLRKEKELISAEKEELMKFKEEILAESKQYKEQKEALEKQLKEMELAKGEISTAYFTKEEYLAKLDKLNIDLKKAETELKRNKKDFIPLDRIHKSYERDNQKLQRKAAIVAKHKIAVYGVSNPALIDESKKQKLAEEDAALKELKESVKHCEQVIQQNKDRYPVLRKANQILTENVERIKQEIEVCNKALKWFEENENN